MKQTMKYLIMAALVIMGAIMAGCKKETPAIEENNIVTLTVSVGFSEDESTKALDVDYINKTVVKTFAEGESIAVIYKSGENTLKAESSPLPATDWTEYYGKSLTGKTYAAGQFYNITNRMEKLAVFTVGIEIGKKVKVVFAPGNLQATWDGSSWSWAFAANLFTRLNYWIVACGGQPEVTPPELVGVENPSGAPSAAAPKIFFRYYFVNASTGEKSDTMLAVSPSP